jgi:oligopeptide transport system substrate-binding protein
VLPSSFVRAWERASDPDFAGEYGYLYNFMEGGAAKLDGTAETISGVTADDEAMTLVVKMAEPYANFDAVAGFQTFYPMPSAVDALADQNDWENGIMIGNGPFIQPEPWDHEKQIKLARNDTYFGGITGEKAKLDTVTFVISADVESAYADFEAGNGDLGRIPSGRFAEATAKYGHATEPILGMYNFFINQESQLGGAQNLKLRQAMSLAIDRQAINDTVYDGARVLPTGITPPGIPGYEPGLCDLCTYDLERAKQLYSEWQAEGGSLAAPVTINFNSGSGHEDVVAIVEQNLQALGIQTKQDPRDPTNYFKEMREGACEFCRSGWIWDYPFYDNSVFPNLHSKSIGSDNTGRLNDPEVDRLIDEARATTDEQARLAKYREAEKLGLESVSIVPFNWYTGQIVYDEKVENVIQVPINFVLYERITLKQ